MSGMIPVWKKLWWVSEIRVGYLIGVLNARESAYLGGSILLVPYFRKPPLRHRFARSRGARHVFSNMGNRLQHIVGAHFTRVDRLSQCFWHFSQGLS